MDTCDMKRALQEAAETIVSADIVVMDIAWLLKGRLRHVDGECLEALKRELKDFNMQTYTWKDK